ncbi:MAG TPA: twin-arginine translocase TatA/TatE family subunit [Methylomirabilota bacterium]|nr:twin-arginine translocase TatA/TatE family subunit [Methylomirabilota bacterium]
MGFNSIWHWLIVLVIVLVLFGGRGKISNIMGDLAQGIKAFKKNIKDESKDQIDTPSAKVIEGDVVGHKDKAAG